MVWPDGSGIAGVDISIGFAEGGVLTGYTQQDGWSLPEDEKRHPAWIQLSVPMHGLVSPRFPVDPAAGNVYAFRLTPNDLGWVDFTGMEVDWVAPEIVVHRSGGKMVFRKVASAP